MYFSVENVNCSVALIMLCFIKYITVAPNVGSTTLGGNYMTNMKRITISLPKDLEETLSILKTDPHFMDMTSSQIIRYLLRIGAKAETHKT